MDLDISPWSDGSSFASVVKGKALEEPTNRNHS